MKLPPAPIRFLLLVVGGWMGLRAIMLTPPWPASDGPLGNAPPARSAAARLPYSAAAGAAEYLPVERIATVSTWRSRAFTTVSSPTSRPPFRWVTASNARPSPPLELPLIATRPPIVPGFAIIHPPASVSPVAYPGFFASANSRPATAPARRLSADAWLFLRERSDPGLAPGGTLGGSQAGLRLTHRLNGDARRLLSLSGRLYAPIDRPEGSEAAVGIDWRPIAGLPVNILAERRQRIGREGRSDFAVTVYGGAEARLLRDRVRVEAYGQAGIVGVERRDMFADGSVVATTRVGPVDVGGGAWGGAQPGVSRLDVGPHASFRLPVGRVTIRAAAEWRFRVTGDAAPASGPALAISAGF